MFCLPFGGGPTRRNHLTDAIYSCQHLVFEKGWMATISSQISQWLTLAPPAQWASLDKHLARPTCCLGGRGVAAPGSGLHSAHTGRVLQHWAHRLPRLSLDLSLNYQTHNGGKKKCHRMTAILHTCSQQKAIANRKPLPINSRSNAQDSQRATPAAGCALILHLLLDGK